MTKQEKVLSDVKKLYEYVDDTQKAVLDAVVRCKGSYTEAAKELGYSYESPVRKRVQSKSERVCWS